MGVWRKIGFAVRALLVVAVASALLGWGALLAVQSGLVWDASGLDLTEARALVAELAPDSRVTVFGQSPLAPILAPLARGSERLSLSHVGIHQLPLVANRVVSPKSGDIQVSAGDHWLLLTRPDLVSVLGALALVASPYAPEPLAAAPDNGLANRPVADARGNPVTWVGTGVALPLVLCLAGLWWRRRRGGK